MNEVAREALGLAAGVEVTFRYRDLSSFLGSWVHDEETENVLEEQCQIDPELWRRSRRTISGSRP